MLSSLKQMYLLAILYTCLGSFEMDPHVLAFNNGALSFTGHARKEVRLRSTRGQLTGDQLLAKHRSKQTHCETAPQRGQDYLGEKKSTNSTGTPCV